MSARPIDERNEDDLCREARNYLRSHRPVALALPEPETKVSFTALSEEIGRPAACKLAAVNVIEKVRFVRDDSDYDHEGHLWRMSPAAARWIDRVISEDVVTTPCGCSTGVRNLGDGEFTCTDEDCSSRFGRETAREVLDG